MRLDRRGFMEVGGCSGRRDASSEESRLPKSLQSLTSMVTDIEPIT